DVAPVSDYPGRGVRRPGAYPRVIDLINQPAAVDVAGRDELELAVDIAMGNAARRAKGTPGFSIIDRKPERAQVNEVGLLEHGLLERIASERFGGRTVLRRRLQL